MCETLQDDRKQMSLLICWFLVASRGEYYSLGLFLVGLSWKLLSRKWVSCFTKNVLLGVAGLKVAWALVLGLLAQRPLHMLARVFLRFWNGQSSNKKSKIQSCEFSYDLILFPVILSDKLVQPSPSHFEYVFCCRKKHTTDSLQISLAMRGR